MQIVSCSLIDLLIIAVRNFQRFSDRSFVSAFELVFILKKHKKKHSNKYFLTICSTALIRVLEVTE